MASPRRFDRLRARVEEPETPAARTLDDDIRDVFASAMGQRVLAGLIAETGAASHIGAPDAALREAEGARRYIANLKRRATPA